jgi:hypothetical protein
VGDSIGARPCVAILAEAFLSALAYDIVWWSRIIHLTDMDKVIFQRNYDFAKKLMVYMISLSRRCT